MRLFDGRVRLAAAGLAIVAVFAAVFFVALAVHSVVAGPDAGPAAAPPNPGHSWSEIGDLPGTMWHSNNDGPGSGLDADLLDGLHASEIGVGRPGFSITTVDSTDGWWTSVTVGVDGLPVISYYDYTNADLKVTHCGNAVCSAGNTITTVDSAGDVGWYPSVTVGADGLPVISYWVGFYGDLKVAHCGDPDCSESVNANTITTVDSSGRVGEWTSVTVGADGLPVISYWDYTNEDLKVAHCGNAACSAGNTITTVDSGDNVGQYTSVTVGADGLPVISYYDVTNLDLKVAHCGNAACSAGNTITTVDSGDNVGQYTSVTVGADGLPVISYYDVTNLDLKVAHCGNAACSAGNTITIVDSTGIPGRYTSVTVGADGLPVISYYGLTNSELKVAHCGNAACTSSTTTTVDSADDVGGYTSVTVGADGLPVISYNDMTNWDLKVAHCSNRFCVPYHRPR